MANEHTSLATKYRPTDWDSVVGQDTVKQILRHQVETSTFKQAYLLCGKWGSGKAQPLDSKLLGAHGYFTMGQATPGMKVYGEDGKLHTIVDVFPQGVKRVYRVHFSDGTYAECCQEHLWNVRKSTSDIVYTKPLRDFEQEVNRRDSKSKPKFFVPVNEPLEFESKFHYIHPYIMGVLISNAYTYSGSTAVDLFVYNSKKSAVDAIQQLDELKELVPDNCSVYRLSSTHITISIATSVYKAFGMELHRLLNFKNSEEIRIHPDYLYDSLENRVALLRGLYDGSQYANKSDYFSYITHGQGLSEDFRWLIQSLGGVVTASVMQSYHSGGGERIYTGSSEYTMTFDLPANVAQSLLNDALTSKTPKKSQKPHRLWKRITRIEMVGDRVCQCIMTDNPSGLYLTDNMIVTHNTTIARIMAKDINKTDYDIIEIDAASNNGAEQVRAISEEAHKKPLVGKYKIFILDEAHLTSAAAWGCWLKLLEEPPASAIFIFATTDPQKLPNTILSRVQRYDFTNIPKDKIAGRLKYIAEKEHIDIDEESIDYIAKVANGGMRDAIAMLDKCNSINSTIRMQQVTDTLGLTNYDAYLSFLVHLVQKDVTKAVEDISNVFYAGKDMKQFMGQFLQCVCDVCNYYVFNKSFKYISIPNIPENVTLMSQVKLEQCVPILSWAKSLNANLRGNTNPKNAIEAEVMLWCLK